MKITEVLRQKVWGCGGVIRPVRVWGCVIRPVRVWGCVIRPVRLWGCDGVIRPVRLSGRDKISEVVGVWWSDN